MIILAVYYDVRACVYAYMRMQGEPVIAPVHDICYTFIHIMIFSVLYPLISSLLFSSLLISSHLISSNLFSPLLLYQHGGCVCQRKLG